MESTLLALLFPGLAAADATDLASRRIPNWITASLAAGGLVLNALAGGWGGLFASLAGMAAGLGLMLAPYALGVLGAGDAKLMAAAGAVLGPAGAFWSFLFASLAGGVYALAVLLARHREVLGRSLAWCAHAAVSLRAGTGVPAAPRAAEGLPRLCYGLAIAVGTSAYVLLKGRGMWIFG